MNISEDTFTSWSKGPSVTETAKCENAETAVRKAIDADSALQGLDITVFAQGSYRARTNVRQNSDVDICVRYNGSFFSNYPSDTTKETFGHVDGTFPFAGIYWGALKTTEDLIITKRCQQRLDDFPDYLGTHPMTGK
jgi:hypothetical protein